MEGLAKADLEQLLEGAARFRRDVVDTPVKKSARLRGRACVNLFFEASTRTKTSFELAGKYLGADVINFQSRGSSVEKGETLYDTALNVEAMAADVLVVRHSASGVPAELQRHLDIPVVNAGDGHHEHPTQGLLDLKTVWDAKGHLDNLSVVIVGDILHSRVARSDLWGFLTMGSHVTLVGPPIMQPLGLVNERVRVTSDMDAAIQDADVVQVLRIQKERQAMVGMPSEEEYRERWGLTAARAGALRPDAVILHPGPQNRGVEIDSLVMDDPRAKILTQVRNGVAVRMAVLDQLIGGQDDN
ncbi:aspartate carbamoyltransferase catalytic subunit [Sulfobacillus harzensis]|uniref:aspartate carbamoyltransferase catalytic subunit n=1 Tax=Sulfobacillus harzensis TaxID=2729629 RepID=UPI001A9B199F|nr:aspartate carbamoyltransferase catalytic subunit [Sulfobacillus harzensis]